MSDRARKSIFDGEYDPRIHGMANLSEAIWITWWEIAESHSAKATKETEAAGEEVVHAGRESSMITLVAAACAIEGLALAVQTHTPLALPDFNDRTGTAKRTIEILKRGFEIGAFWAEWVAEVNWLFEVRNPMVHHRSGYKPAVFHPAFAELQVAPEVVLYTAPSARRAVAIIRTIAKTCFEHPRHWNDVQADFWVETGGLLARGRLRAWPEQA